MVQDFVVQTGSFTGPMDLLLQLIEKRKLFIGDISLATVSDDFLEYVGEAKSFPIHHVAHFLVIASTLLLIKSKSLLPYLELSDEESQDIEDLEHRLQLYKQIRDLGKHVQKYFGRTVLFTTSRNAPIDPMFAPHDKITSDNMLDSARNVIQTFPPVENIKKTVVAKVMSLEEMIDQLTIRIQNSVETSFKSLTETDGIDTKEKKVHVIVSFLALLELVKKGTVGVRQHNMFDDIAIEKT